MSESNTTHSPLVEPDMWISHIRLSRELSPQVRTGSCTASARQGHQTGGKTAGCLLHVLAKLLSPKRKWLRQPALAHGAPSGHRSAVVGRLSKRFSLLLTSACSRPGPFAPRSLLASSLLWACPTPGQSHPRGYVFPQGVGPHCTTLPGLPGSSTDLSTRAVPSHPGKSGGCSYPLLHRRCQASSSWADWPLPLSVTRPNRVRFRYGSRVCRPRLRPPDCSDARSVGYLLNGQFSRCTPFNTRDRPGLSWRSKGTKEEENLGVLVPLWLFPKEGPVRLDAGRH
jgi:hypothetical protein